MRFPWQIKRQERESETEREKAPIFVVGFPRSGTTLLSAMLSSHPDIACGVETHFFSTLSEQDLADAAHDPHWPGLAVQKVAALCSAGQPLLNMYDITEDELRTELIKRSGEKQALLDGLLSLYARREGKTIWLEKTPNHLAQLRRMREVFPDARIIRIVRDPRDSLRSIFQLQWAPDSMLALAYDFRFRHDGAQHFFNTDPNSVTVKYEELVQYPESVLKQLCAFLKIQFNKCMLDTSTAGQKVRSENEPWKQQVSGKLDPGRLYVWKREMDPRVAHAVSAVMDGFIKEFGYDASGEDRIEKLPCMNMTSSNIAARESDLIEYMQTGVIPVPISFREGIKKRSAAWLNGPCIGVKIRMQEKVLRLLGATHLFSFKRI
jgi:hypothetical protein